MPKRVPAKSGKRARHRKPPSSEHTGDTRVKARRSQGRLPTREELLDFIAGSPTPVSKRDIARAFKVGPAERVALKGLIKDIEGSGAVDRGRKRRLAPVGALPEIGVVEITGVDLDGEMLGRPLGAADAEHLPSIYVVAERRGRCDGD